MQQLASPSQLKQRAFRPLAEPTPSLHASGAGERTFRPDVEGLRAIAVVLVLLDHAGLAAIRGGFIGVDVFFVLSGFLITGLLLKEVERTGGISFTQFYARRARRLLPASTLVLLVTLIASYRYLGESRADRIAEDARWSALFASNFRFIQQNTDYLDAQLPPSPLQHFWSLAVEEQFYAAWPALIIVIAAVAKQIPLRRKLVVVLTGIIVASLVWSHHQTGIDGTAAYFSPFPRACELGAGALLAVVAFRLQSFPRILGIVLSWGGVAVVVIAAFVFSATTTFPGYLVAVPVIGTVMAISGGSIAPGSGAEVILRWQPFQWIGKLSYSLYLWHWPVLVIAAGRAGHELSVNQNVLLCLASVGLSAITYVIVENPVRNARFLKSRTPWVSIGIGVTLVVLSFGIADRLGENKALPESDTVRMTGTALPSNEEVVQAVADAVNIKTLPEQPKRAPNPAYSKACNVTRLDTTSSVCVHGDQNGSKTAVIYGDSHAAMWIPALDLIGKAEGWRIVQLTKPACQVADFPVYSGALKREYTECAEYRDFAMSQLETIKPDLVLIASSARNVQQVVDGTPTRDGVEETWDAGLASMLDRIKPLTQRIVVIGEMAYPNKPGIDCLTANASDITACNTPYSDAVSDQHNDRERTVASKHGAEYLDVLPWLCTDTVCPSIIGGLPPHRDAFHIGENYVIWLSTAFGNALGFVPPGDVITAP